MSDKETLYRHFFPTLLCSVPLGGSKRTGKDEENWEGLKLSGTHRILGYADDNILGENINTIQKNTKACKEVICK
jgi:hypothetical protein